MKFMQIFLLLIILCSSVYAGKINVEIEEKMMAELHDLNYENYIENKPFRVDFGIVNPGSVPYTIKARMDIFENSTHLFTAWSKEIPFKIGDDENLQLYWHPLNTTGKYRVFLRIYYGMEIIDDGSIEFRVENTKLPEDVIKVISLKTYEKQLVLTLKSEMDLKDVVIIPDNYPSGWFFSQEKIDELKKNELKKVIIEYEPSLWESGKKIAFQAVTLDGKYFGQSTFALKKESRLGEFIYYSFGKIKSIFENL